MTRFEIIKDVYIKSFEKNIQRVSTRTQNYIKNSNDENIHDMRTSIRRLDAAYSILPRKIRTKKKIKNFAESYKNFFKINSSIRDLDIIISKIPNNSNDEFIDEITRKLKQKRQKRLKKALQKALKLPQLTLPNLPKNKISQKKIQTIFEKIIITLISNIENNMPIVLSDINAVSQLHELRKDCKKLRYYLELIGDDTIPLLEKLKQMQNMLGDIHDNDITIDYLKKIKNYRLEQIIQNETNLRKKNYKRFVSRISRQESF